MFINHVNINVVLEAIICTGEICWGLYLLNIIFMRTSLIDIKRYCIKRLNIKSLCTYTIDDYMTHTF